MYEGKWEWEEAVVLGARGRGARVVAGGGRPAAGAVEKDRKTSMNDVDVCAASLSAEISKKKGAKKTVCARVVPATPLWRPVDETGKNCTPPRWRETMTSGLL